MTIHYHGTPITPIEKLMELKGRHFCVSHAAPGDVARCHKIGQSVVLDNGAFSAWRKGKPVDWEAFYAWADVWLAYPTTWAVIPDVIDAGAEAQDELLKLWPFGMRGAPVYHMDEDISRLLRLVDHWPKVCIGSTSTYATVLSPAWRERMTEIWDAIAHRHRRTPWIHMLRGMQCCEYDWPFASVDSTDIGRNHNRPKNTPRAMADRWDGCQTPAEWLPTSDSSTSAWDDLFG